MTERPLPAALFVVAVVALLATGGMVFSGAVTTGISSDEPTHVKRLTNFQETGKYALSREIVEVRGGMPDRAYVYSPATALLQHEANRLAGNDDGRVSRTTASYLVRHLVIAAIGLAGLVAAGALAALLLGSWRWGVVAAAALAAIPMWTGHSMFNPKDISVASGHTLVTLSLAVLTLSRTRASWRWPVISAVTLAAGTVLMVGTRPAMWVSLAASVLILILGLAWSRMLSIRSVAAVGAGLAASYAALLAIYPRVFSDPVTAFMKSALVSSDFERQRMVSDRSYVFVHTAAEWPVLLLAAMVAGTLAAALLALRSLRARTPEAVGLLLVASQAFGLVAVAVVRDSNLYNGLRQLLFAIPTQAVLATVGLAVLLAAARSRRARVIATSLACLALALPVAAQAAMFPYQYATLNAAADVLGVQSDTDYWDTSFRALEPHVSSDVKALCPHFPEHEFWVRSRADCRVKIGGTLNPFWIDSERPALDDPKAREFNALARGTLRAPDYCETTHRIMRWRNFERITIGRVVH
ncbi:MAG TPA: hypothetical protein VK948_04070, partial [Aeromicrobium sp.]|nr:hypothetical protein [Aeromicrobium sp.]